LRDVIRCVAGNGLRRKRRFERIVRVEWRPTRWGRRSKIEPEAKNEVLQKAIAWHLVRSGALDGADDAKLRLMARGAAEKGSGKYSCNKSFGTTSALLKQYEVIAVVPDDVWISIPGAPGDLKAMRAVDDGENSQGRKEGEDTSTTSVDFRLACDLLAPIETFLETAFDAYVGQTAKEEAGGRHLYVRAGGGGSAKDDDEEDKSGGAATYSGVEDVRLAVLPREEGLIKAIGRVPRRHGPLRRARLAQEAWRASARSPGHRQDVIN
jgi:hypothetical protein